MLEILVSEFTNYLEPDENKFKEIKKAFMILYNAIWEEYL